MTDIPAVTIVIDCLPVVCWSGIVSEVDDVMHKQSKVLILNVSKCLKFAMKKKKKKKSVHGLTQRLAGVD